MTYDPGKREIVLTASEGKRFKELGDIGEQLAKIVLIDSGFDSVRNLNEDKMNFPFADFYACRNSQSYLISVKTRNKFERSGKLNSRYKLGKNNFETIQMALFLPEFSNCLPAWIAISMEDKTFDAYFGLISQLCQSRGINMSKSAKKTYQCLALNRLHTFSSAIFKNEYRIKEKNEKRN